MQEYELYKRYVYDGPVLIFDNLVTDRWKGETMAPTVRKARSNLSYQFKKQNNRLPGTPVVLPGKIKIVV